MAKFFESTAGKVAVAGIFVAAVAIAGYSIFTNVGSSEAVSSSTERWFVCSETGKPFQYKIKVGDREPYASPHSGKKTGFEAEYCYWTKDGKAKPSPTYVLLNSRKGVREPTFCPDCGRLVVALNPPASEGTAPPPTESEYKSRRTNAPGNNESP